VGTVTKKTTNQIKRKLRQIADKHQRTLNIAIGFTTTYHSGFLILKKSAQYQLLEKFTCTIGIVKY
jgi:hypothetical protein